MGEKTFKEKAVDFFGKIALGVENGLKVLKSTRIYLICGAAYLGVNHFSDLKFLGLCAIVVAYIISEDRRKLNK